MHIIIDRPGRLKFMNALDIVHYIVEQADRLRLHYIENYPATVDFGCIFSQTEAEYQQLTEDISPIARIVQDTPTGFTYLLNEPLVTKVGLLKLVKIRKPDKARPERGDADFSLDYSQLKQQVAQDHHFELVIRPEFEMLRLSDSQFDVMACFSKVPLSKALKLSRFEKSGP